MAIENTGIYEIGNIHNGNRYIGSATRIDGRWRDHKRSLGRNNHHAIALQRAWNKYGESAFEFSKLLICSKENLIMYEQAFFDFYQPAYNSAPIAGSQLGFRHTQASRLKMSASNRRLKPNLGRKFSAEHAAKISASKTGVKQSPEIVAKRQAAIREKYTVRPASRHFSEADILIIRARSQAGDKNIHIARDYSVSDSVISEIKNRKAYSWVI